VTDFRGPHVDPSLPLDVDEESGDAGNFATPDANSRVGSGAAPTVLTAKRSGNNRRVLAFGAVVLLAIGFLVIKGLGEASTYFRTADEARAQRATLGDSRFRLEGTVVDKSVKTVGTAVTFLVESNGQQIKVSHEGDPPELFRANLSVVVEGRFAPGQANLSPSDIPLFSSDHLMIKHDENYIEKNPKRVDDYVGKGSDKQ
jgi:cytochrome c-type biogenesis protein CcmE